MIRLKASHVMLALGLIAPLCSNATDLCIATNGGFGNGGSSFIGGSKQSKKGFDLIYAMISVKASGEGKGEIRPAARIKWMESGAPAPVGYDNQIVWLENVTKSSTGN